MWRVKCVGARQQRTDPVASCYVNGTAFFHSTILPAINGQCFSKTACLFRSTLPGIPYLILHSQWLHASVMVKNRIIRPFDAFSGWPSASFFCMFGEIKQGGVQLSILKHLLCFQLNKQGEQRLGQMSAGRRRWFILRAPTDAKRTYQLWKKVQNGTHQNRVRFGIICCLRDRTGEKNSPMGTQ